MKQTQYYAYVIKNTEGMLYKGSTSNVKQRVKNHNEGKSTWTRGKGHWELVYCEECASRSEAVKREKFFKSGKGREFLKTQIIGE